MTIRLVAWLGRVVAAGALTAALVCLHLALMATTRFGPAGPVAPDLAGRLPAFLATAALGAIGSLVLAGLIDAAAGRPDDDAGAWLRLFFGHGRVVLLLTLVAGAAPFFREPDWIACLGLAAVTGLATSRVMGGFGYGEGALDLAPDAEARGS